MCVYYVEYAAAFYLRVAYTCLYIEYMYTITICILIYHIIHMVYPSYTLYTYILYAMYPGRSTPPPGSQTSLYPPPRTGKLLPDKYTLVVSYMKLPPVPVSRRMVVPEKTGSLFLVNRVICLHVSIWRSLVVSGMISGRLPFSEVWR